MFEQVPGEAGHHRGVVEPPVPAAQPRGAGGPPGPHLHGLQVQGQAYLSHDQQTVEPTSFRLLKVLLMLTLLMLARSVNLVKAKISFFWMHLLFGQTKASFIIGY